MTVELFDTITNEKSTFRSVINVRYDNDLKGVYLTQIHTTGSVASYYFEDVIILEVKK